MPESIVLLGKQVRHRLTCRDVWQKPERVLQVRQKPHIRVRERRRRALAALVATKPHEKPKSVTVRITYPNSCTLKYDDVDLRLRQMLVDSGIEPREPTENMGLAETEIAEA